MPYKKIQREVPFGLALGYYVPTLHAEEIRDFTVNER